jgi:hypothetical protein
MGALHIKERLIQLIVMPVIRAAEADEAARVEVMQRC